MRNRLDEIVILEDMQVCKQTGEIQVTINRLQPANWTVTDLFRIERKGNRADS